MKNKLIAMVITAGHLDIEWYQPLRSYRFWTMETFCDLKTASARNDFISYVLDGQVFPLEDYLEAYPEDLAVMRELISKKKLAIGPFYTQFDEWLPSAEAIIRNCLYGNRKAAKYGHVMNAGYLPDNFGHPMQMPQILNGFGIDSLLFMRGLPEIPGGHPDEFIYEGIDGSKVICSHFRESYSSAFDIFQKETVPIQPRDIPYYSGYLSFEWHRELAEHSNPKQTAATMVERALRVAERYPSGIIPLVSGWDHLPPQINIGETVKEANEIQDSIQFIMGSAEEYINLLRERMSESEVYRMELLGSRYQNILMGTLSTRSYLKTQHFAAEIMLERYAEPLLAIASSNGIPHSRSMMDEAWKYIMLNSAHDSIHGSSVDEVHIEMEARYASVRQIVSGIIHSSLAGLGKIINRWWNESDNAVIVYSPSQSVEAHVMEVWLPVGDEPFSIISQDGRMIPAQLVRPEPIPLNGIGLPSIERFPHEPMRKILFQDKIPFMGFASYAVSNKESRIITDLVTGECFIENTYLRAEFAGGLINLYDKMQNKWYYGLNLLEEEADSGDVWDFSPTWIPSEIVRSSSAEFTCSQIECGPVRASFKIAGSLNVPSCIDIDGERRSKTRLEIPVCFLVIMYAHTARLDVKLIIENTVKDHRIRLRLAPNIASNFVRSQGHLAVIDRPVERGRAAEQSFQPITQLLPFREWLAVQDEHCGFAVAVKGLYDYEAVMNPLTNRPELMLTLLRGVGMMGKINMAQRSGPASWAFETHGSQCLGERIFEWSYIPYAANADDKAPFLSLANSFLFPPVTHAVRSKPNPIPKTQGRYLNWKGFSWDAKNIIFSAFKKCTDGDGVILRLYENQGKGQEQQVSVKLRIEPYMRAWLCNLNEDVLEELQVREGAVELLFGAYKTVTVKLNYNY